MHGSMNDIATSANVITGKHLSSRLGKLIGGSGRSLTPYRLGTGGMVSVLAQIQVAKVQP